MPLENIETPGFSWSSVEVSQGEQYDAWASILNESHLKWELEKPSSQTFHASISLRELDELRLVHCLCDPCGGIRKAREISQSDIELFGFVLIQEGREFVEADGQDMILGPGDMFVWDSTKKVRFQLLSRLRKTTLFVPRETLREKVPQIDRLAGLKLNTTQGAGALAAAHLNAMGREAFRLDIEEGCRIAGPTAELLATGLRVLVPNQTDTLQSDLLPRIQRYIAAHIDDPELKPGSIAQAHRISTRYLHMLFESTGLTVGRYITKHRLKKCRADLLRPSSISGNITTIAFRWGFYDSAHFSRVFKAEYGLSPGAFRRQHRS